MIGVISHVPEIAERLPDRIEVLKAPGGSSIAAGAGTAGSEASVRALDPIEA
jgi:hypothetical protein